MSKKLLFSVSIKNCEIQTFRCPGKGGQNVNKVSSGVRLIHRPSNARAESCETRDQHRNKRLAFLRLIETPEFKLWHKLETSRRLGNPSPEDIVDAIMDDRAQFKVEVRTENGWELLTSK